MGNLEDAFRDAAGEVAQIKAQPSNRYWWLYGTIKAKNENGTLDVAIDGVTIQQVKATVSCMMANVGDRVVVLKAGPIMTCIDVVSNSMTGTAYSTRDWLRLSSTPVTLERGSGHKIGPKVFLIGHSEFPTNSNDSSGYVRIWATWGGWPGIGKSAADVTFTMRNDLHAFVNQFSGSVSTAGTNSLAVRKDSSGILWFYLYTDFEYYTAEVRAAGEQFVVDAKWQDSEPSGNLVWSSDNPTAYTAHGNQLYSGMSIGRGLEASGKTLSVDKDAYVSCTAERKLFTGSVVRTVGAGADSVRVWSSSEFSSEFGRAFEAPKDYVGFANGDAVANDVHIQGASYVNTDAGVYAVFNKSRPANASVRLNYLVVLA